MLVARGDGRLVATFGMLEIQAGYHMYAHMIRDYV